MNVSGKNGWDYELLILSVNHGKQQTLFLPYVQVFFSWSTWFKYSYTVATRNTLSRVLVQNKSEQCSKYSSSTFRGWHQFSQTSNSFNPHRICPEILNSNWFPWVIRVATICFRTSNFFQQIQQQQKSISMEWMYMKTYWEWPYFRLLFFILQSSHDVNISSFLKHNSLVASWLPGQWL